MSTSSIDINLIPTNVLIYEKVDSDFVLVTFNKTAQKIKMHSDLYDVLLRVYNSSEDAELQSAIYEDSHVKTWRHYVVKKLPDSNLIVFYNDNSLSRHNDSILEHQKEMFQDIMNDTDLDLKELRHLQKELRIQKNLLQTIIDIIPDLIWLKDLNGKYMYCNQRFEQFFGAKEIEILGKTDFDFIDADQANFFRQNDLKALEEKAPRRNEEYLTFNDGSYEGIFETTKVPMLDDDNNVIGVLGIAHDINQRKEHEKKLKKYASHDLLTGLSNRKHFNKRLSYLLLNCECERDVHAVLFVDLDHFKNINDEKGHSAGDKVLIEVANRLKGIVRKGDSLSRFGGDEFIILLENITNKVEASHVAQKIVDVIRKPIVVDGEKLYVTTSIGIAVFPDDAKEVDALIHYSDLAMYRAKSKGKDTFEFYSE